MAQITLVYRADVGLQVPANYVAKVQAIELSAELEPLSMTKTSDVTVLDGSSVKRTVVLQTTPEADVMYPSTDLKKAVTRDLWTEVIASRIPARVVADEPVVA